MAQVRFPTIPGSPSPIFARQAIVAKLYDWLLGGMYDFFMDVFAPGYRGAIIRFYQRYLPTLPPLRSVLEVGPGTGYVTLVVFDKQPSAAVTCLDISSRMLDKLRKRTEKARPSQQVNFVLADITQPVPLEDDSFQLVIVQSVIEHLPDIAPAFSQMHRMLEPGGTLMVSDICDGFWGRLFAGVFRVRSFTKRKIGDALQTAGFENVQFLDYEANFLLRGTLFFASAQKAATAARSVRA